MKTGPVYGVELIDSLPLGNSGMRQAMPSFEDLALVKTYNERTVAGYETLLFHWHRLDSRARELEAIVRRAIWNGGTALVPMFVASCPECGEQLLIHAQEWISDSGKPTGVEYECVGEEVDHAGHKWHQSDWQPVMDAVETWFEVK